MVIHTIDPHRYGVSFSLKQCRNFGLDPKKTLAWLLKMGWRRFRLMSYWNEHETAQGAYDFSELDWQIQMIEKHGGEVSLCLGVKQPRWPEYHWPAWALTLPEQQKTQALLDYLTAVIQWYDKADTITSYQLENEALLRGFGRSIEINRRRLRAEYELVSRLDTSRPVYMSTSNGWGVPLRRPLPWGFGFSIYTNIYSHGRYHGTIHRPWLHRVRAWYIRWVLRRPVFIHELQVEPWGPKAIWEMTTPQQNQSMSPERIAFNINFAQSCHATPIDLWGGEWWYWRYQNGDKTIWQAVKDSLKD
jgi:hypothetical protein